MSEVEIGKRIQQIRDFRGWSQTKLGNALCGCQTMICRIEAGRPVLLSEIGKMADLLHFSIDVLMRSGPFDLTACLLPMPTAQTQ